MNQNRPKLLVVEPRQDQWKEPLVAMLRDVIEKIESNNEHHLAGVAVAVAWDDGSVASVFDGSDYNRLLAAVTMLQSRILNEYK